MRFRLESLIAYPIPPCSVPVKPASILASFRKPIVPERISDFVDVQVWTFLLAESYILGFLSDCGHAASCEVKPKLEKVSVYVEGLLSHGGPSTDVFRKAMGEEKTAELFRKVLFGTEA